MKFRVLAFSAAMLAVIGMAQAHTHLESATPADNSVLASPPAQIMLHFSEPTRLTALSIQKSYGVLLLAKITGFAVLMALASINKWRYGPALATTAAAAVSFRRSVAIEYGLICVVLVVTAIMTTFFSPEQ